MFKISIKWWLAAIVAIPIFMYGFTSYSLLNSLQDTADDMKTSLYDTSYQVDSLVLNADRDMYQALLSYTAMASGKLDKAGMDEERATMNQNIAEAQDRLAKAQQVLQSKELGSLNAGVVADGKSLTELGEAFANDFAVWVEMSKDGRKRSI